MGVPKFYRWVSERYPCLSQVVQEHQIPEFDNMYLDMNGIIHPCSHPNDDDPHFRITEEQIFRNIFHYIEILFQIIKPKKVFFMAVDGVAPRAKMNQQRGRRFRSAKEAEDNIRRAIEKGQVLPKEERFDSNCITPGTGFMTRLQEQLKYFVNEKITNDPAWRGLRVYLSGHQTPGEGEHKIMEFIRTERSKPDYDPNTRHCLYGLDADLIMLGLSSHDPHFSLLREEVRFGKTTKRIEKPENITFHLLHLSLFREYLDWEFHAVKDLLSFPYDLERIIDDWILMGFLVGNDFIPHLPHFHINHNALPILYKVYTEVLPSLDGYLHDGGVLNLGRFEKYLAALSKLDREKFDEIFVDMKWFEAKIKHGFDAKPGRSSRKANKRKGFEVNPFAALDSLSSKLDQTKLDDEEELSPELVKLAAASALDDNDDNEESKEDQEEDVFEIEFAMYKKQYYREKFEIESINSDQLAHFVWEYVRGIQWILHYYFNGVQSWGWYYPYHYAPFLSDLTDFSHYELEFDMGKPFLPFEQLLAVLPAASKQLLPAPLQNLMIMEESPIIEYYPLTFKTDLNGKQQEWEAVVLIPFIDQKCLLDAMQPLYPRLTKEETKRNSHGPYLVYTYDSELSLTYPSSLPGVFPDIQLCQARCEEFDRQALVTPMEKLIKGLCKDVKLDVYFPGFPTLHHIEHTAELRKANVKVFQMHSRWESMILKLSPKEKKDTHKIAEELLDEICYVGWPHMVEGKVTSVSDNTFRYTIPRDKPKTKDGNKNIHVDQKVLTEEMLGIFKKQALSYKQTQLERRGIEVGYVDVVIEACPIQGRRFLCGSKGQVTLEKEWSTVPKPFAYQAVAKDIFVHESHSESNIKSIEQLFPINSSCFMLAAPHYGAQGEVLEVDVNQGRVRVQLKVPTEPSFASIIMQKESLSDVFIPAHILAQKLGISNSLLGKITAKFLIERGSREKSKGQGQSKLDIGLNMKHSKHNKELLGYVRRTEQGSWLFTNAAQKIIMEYTRKFPQLFDIVAVLEAQFDQIYESDLLIRGITESKLQEVQEWLKSLPLSKQEPMPCGSDVLDDQILTEIDKVVQDTKKSSNTKAVRVRVRPYLLFRPSDYLGNTLPDSDAEFQLFDRVMNVKLNSAVPFGLRGTIVGFHEDQDGDEMVEVMYDESFVGNQPIRRTSKNIYLVRPSSFIDLTYGERREAKKRGQPVPPPRPLNKTFSAAVSGSKNNGSPQRDKPNGGSPRTGRRGPQDSPLASSQNIAKGGKNTATPVVTRIATPPSRAASHGQKYLKDRNEGRRETAPRFMKNNVGTPQGNGKNSSEFASMWKELQMKENSPPKSESEKKNENQKENVSSAEDELSKSVSSEEKKHNTVSKERTQALCELLHIGRHSPSTSDQSPNENDQHREPDTENREPKGQVGRKQLSVEELFKTQETPSAQSQPPFPVHATPGALPSQVLVNYCLSKGLPPPRFHYGQGPQGIFATVELANGLKYSGSQSRDHVEATESACAIALSLLNRIDHSVNVQRMPAQPFIPPVMPPYPGFPFQPMMRAVQSYHPSQQPRMPVHAEPKTVPAATVSSALKEKTLRPNAAPFIPMQVTRRNLPAKPESPTSLSQEKTSPESKGIERPSLSKNLLTNDIPPKTNEPVQKNPSSQPTSPQVLIPPSSFTDSKGKGSTLDGSMQVGDTALNSPGFSKCIDQKSAPHGPSNESNHVSEEPKMVSTEGEVPKESTLDDSKKSRPGSAKKPGKRSQRMMAANFSQKK